MFALSIGEFVADGEYCTVRLLLIGLCFLRKTSSRHSVVGLDSTRITLHLT